MGIPANYKGTEYGWDCIGCEDCNPYKTYLPSKDYCDQCNWDSCAYAMDRSYDIFEDIRNGL